MSLWLSWLGVVAAVLGWGSFTAPMKAAAVQRAQLHFLVFALYQALGIFLSSLLLLAVVPWSFTWWAALSAAAWVPANMAAVLCVRFVGIAVGQAVWSGLVALVSFLWGQTYFHTHMHDRALGSLGIALLVAGISALGLISGGGCAGGAGDGEAGTGCDADADADADASVISRATTQGGKRLVATSAAGAAGSTASVPLLADEEGGGGGDGSGGGSGGRDRRVVGLSLAVVVGVLAGSTMVPLRLAPEHPYRDGVHAVAFDLGFAVGVLAITLGMVGCYKAASSLRSRHGGGALLHSLVAAPLDLHVGTCLLPGLASGVLWNVGNVGSILAVLPPLGLTAGYPITQSCLLVSGLWGILAFGELRGARAIGAFFAAALVVLSGAALLGVYGAA